MVVLGYNWQLSLNNVQIMNLFILALWAYPSNMLSPRYQGCASLNQTAINWAEYQLVRVLLRRGIVSRPTSIVLKLLRESSSEAPIFLDRVLLTGSLHEIPVDVANE